MKKLIFHGARPGIIFFCMEVKVVLKTHKYCFLKAFLNGLVSQILNNNRTDLNVNFCPADDIKVFFSRSDCMLSNFKL